MKLIKVFPKIGVSQNGWFIKENIIKIHDLGGNTPIFGNTHSRSCLPKQVLHHHPPQPALILEGPGCHLQRGGSDRGPNGSGRSTGD